MDRLTLTCARQRMVRGRSERQAASTFLSEIGSEGVIVEDLTWQEDHAPVRRAGRGGFHADAEERAAIEARFDPIDEPDEVPLPPEYEYLCVGSRVESPKFGRGMVVRIGKERWPETRIDVHFETGGPKRLVLVHARLEVL
jgi:DNA helicase-2/ATP-dependent DNA helicase PcrA